MVLTYLGLENGKTVYVGLSGTKYQYNLSNPTDRLAYSVDLNAQMRDQLSLNLNKNSENGGGIYE